jgi:CelD/BcsL family acetyltransferase involved in cellulose biosynthesis
MQISVARPSELGPDEIAAWHSMQRQTGSLASPCLSPEFAVAIDTFLPNARVAVLTDGPDIVGFFPFQRRRLGVGIPIGTPMNECQGLIHKPGVELDARDLLRACRLSVWQFDCLAEGQRHFASFVTEVAPSPVIDLTDGFPAYQEKLRAKSPQFCKDLARKTRNLQREAGELRFVVDSRGLAELRTLMRWKSDQCVRTGMIDVFDRPWIVAVIDHFFSTRTDPAAGLLSVLYAGETPVAAHFGFRSICMLQHCWPAYDPRFGKHSPGLIHHLKMAEETPFLGVRMIDLGKGPERYKQALKNHDLFVGEGMAARGPLLAAAHRARTGAVRWASPYIRQHAHLYHATDRILRHFGRTT